MLGAGTFAPWLASGESVRNSYSAAGVLRAEVRSDWERIVLSSWPFVTAMAALALLLLVLGLLRTGALVTLGVTACAAAASCWALTQNHAGIVRAVESGPLCTALGSALAGLPAAATLFRSYRPGRN